MDWIDLAQDSSMWWAFLNTVMNFWLSKPSEIFGLAEEPVASQVGPRSVELIF